MSRPPRPAVRTLGLAVVLLLSVRCVSAAAPDPSLAGAPFAPPSQAEQQALDAFLVRWQAHSQATRTLECQFTRWHFDSFAAPTGVAAEKSLGVIKYATPDKGLFKVETRHTYKGLQDATPQYSEALTGDGDHWVCNGAELLEFDHAQKQCRIQELPPGMQGQRIFESPLPFVFNLDAVKIKQRYWVRQVANRNPGTVLIEAYPKRQEDRAQYKLVQIALDEQTLLPQALLMYAPNYDAKTAPKWDHYQFANIARNSLSHRVRGFVNSFIDETPPSDWKVFREAYQPPAEAQVATPQSQTRR